MPKVKKLYFTYTVYIVLVLCVLYILKLVFLPSGSGTRDFDAIKKSGVLQVVTEYDAVGYYVDGDTIAGEQYRMINELAQSLGVGVQFHLENNLKQSIEGLLEGEYDIIARKIPITTENKQILAFTKAIMYDKQVLIQRTSSSKDEPDTFVRNQLELAKKTVYVPENSPAILRLQHLAEEIADTIYVVEDKDYSAEQLVYKLVNKEIDFAVIGRQAAQMYKQRFPEIDCSTDIGFTQKLSWAVRKDSPALLDSINTWLAKRK